MIPITPEIVDLVTAPHLVVDWGAELLDDNDEVIDDLTHDEVNGHIDRNNFADIHGTCELILTKELDWANARVRPYQVLSVGPHVVDVEIEDRPALTVSATDSTAETWDDGTFTDTIIVGNALCLNHA